MSDIGSQTGVAARIGSLALVALALLLAELACTVYFVPPLNMDLSMGPSLATSRVIMCAACLAVLVVVAKRLIPPAIVRSDVLVAFAGIAMAIRPIVRALLNAFAAGASIPPWADVTIRILWGVGFALQLCVAAEAVARQAKFKFETLVFLAFVFAGIVASIAVVTENLGGAFMRPVMAVLSSVALIAIGHLPHDLGEGSAELRSQDRAGDASPFNKSAIVVLVLDGVLIGIAACHAFRAFAFGMISPVGAGLPFVVTALVAHALYRINPVFLLRSRNQVILLPFVFLFLLGMNFAPAPFSHYSALGLLAVLLVFDYANLFTLVRQASQVRGDALVLFARGRIPIVAGEVLGWLCGIPVSGDAGNALILGMSIFSFALICLQLSISVLSNPQAHGVVLDVEGGEGDAAPAVSRGNGEGEKSGALPSVDGVISAVEPVLAVSDEDALALSYDLHLAQCDAVAERYGLTEREKDVLVLLSRGRSVRYIADDLVISEATAKTHVSRIYRKVGTHSRQELIDIVESAPVAQEGQAD